MKMKKSIALLLIMTGVLLTVTGCRKDVSKEIPEEAHEVESTKEEESSEHDKKVEAEEVIEDTEDSVSEDTEEVKPLQLNKDRKEVNYLDQETYDYYIEYVDEKIILSEEDAEKYPALAKVLNEELSERNRTYQSDIDSLIETYNDNKESGNDAGMKSYNRMSVERADSVVLSICDSVSGYTGGAHGMYGCYGYNYDTKTGQALKFSDVVSDPVAFLNLANDKIQKGYRDDSETPSTLDDYMNDYDTSIIWTVDYQGVRIYFEPYALGSYALGEVETEIYFKEAPEVFNPKYMNVPESYVMDLKSHELPELDINNDGENEKITITSKYDEYFYVIGADIEVSGKAFSFDNAIENCFFVSNKGKNYILVSTSNEGGFWEIYSIDLSSMSLDLDNSTSGFLASLHSKWDDDGERMEYNSKGAVFTDPDKVLISTYIQFLGTMDGYDYYHMGEDKLVPDTGVYCISDNSVITANTDIDCEEVDLDGNVKGNTVIPEGTRLVVRRGDGETFADLIEVPEDADISDYEYYVSLNSELKIEDANIIYRVNGELNEYGGMAVINGQEEYLVFNNILYAD